MIFVPFSRSFILNTYISHNLCTLWRTMPGFMRKEFLNRNNYTTPLSPYFSFMLIRGKVKEQNLGRLVQGESEHT